MPLGTSSSHSGATLSVPTGGVTLEALTLLSGSIPVSGSFTVGMLGGAGKLVKQGGDTLNVYFSTNTAGIQVDAGKLTLAPPAPSDHESQLTEALTTLNSTARAEALRRLGRELAADPERGMALAARIVNFDDRSEFLRAFVHAWAARDPERALAYAQGQPQGLMRGDSIGAACGGWATV